MAFNIPPYVSATRGVGFPSHATFDTQMDQFVTETTDAVEKWTKELFGDEIVD